MLFQVFIIAIRQLQLGSREINGLRQKASVLVNQGKGRKQFSVAWVKFSAVAAFLLLQ